jgi:broad specificity phosphatase PhoE
MSVLLLVRHADAGDRAAWSADDVTRPLSRRGQHQAQALVGMLSPLLAVPAPPAAPRPDVGTSVSVHSSPAQRCLATVRPLAANLGTDVVPDEGLFEGASVAGLLARIPGITTPTVWASHGDVIPALLMELSRNGVGLGDDPRCRKASTWVLRLTGDGTSERTIASATYVERPD